MSSLAPFSSTSLSSAPLPFTTGSSQLHTDHTELTDRTNKAFETFSDSQTMSWLEEGSTDQSFAFTIQDSTTEISTNRFADQDITENSIGTSTSDSSTVANMSTNQETENTTQDATESSVDTSTSESSTVANMPADQKTESTTTPRIPGSNSNIASKIQKNNFIFGVASVVGLAIVGAILGIFQCVFCKKKPVIRAKAFDPETLDELKPLNQKTGNTQV